MKYLLIFVEKLWPAVKNMLCKKSNNSSAYVFLKKLELLQINGFKFEKELGGESALSSLYASEDKKVVFKFLISPRNDIELEKFKLEYSVLKENRANSIRGDISLFYGPPTSYPLPTIKYPFTQKLSGLVSFFGYEYEEGTLLSDLDTAKYSLEDKIKLLHRLASGLNYFNQTGYSHRDLHPENILLLDGYTMNHFDNEIENNDPRIKFLDMGSCQSNHGTENTFPYIKRDADELLVYTESNKRLYSSFTSMPPDFLEKGTNTLNYDTWSFGVYAYHLIFGTLPFTINGIEDVTNLRHIKEKDQDYLKNMASLHVGLRLILNHLLSADGNERPSIDSIVRLFSWLVYRKEDFQEVEFVQSVIHNNGFDPYHDPLDDIY
ncbi:protein kinase [Aeromonas sp. S16(2024)]|uniref:protein kinase domain-containing protein n=1 Tax=Aeromonas sp. S16(2024) TaxID=3242889 RepID=UPI00352835CA